MSEFNINNNNSNNKNFNNKNLAGIDFPPDVLRIIEESDTDGSISSVKDVLKRESLSLVEKTNSTFRELCRSLDDEQSRLSVLEEKRKRLQEEMLLLKAEIERERECCRMDLEATGDDQEDLEDLSNLNTFDDTPNGQNESDTAIHDTDSTASFKNNIDQDENLHKSSSIYISKFSKDCFDDKY